MTPEADPILAYLTALADFGERISIVALLLLVAVAFLKRWIVPKQTADDLVLPYREQVNKLTNGMDGKLTEVVTATNESAAAIRDLAEKIEKQTGEATSSRIAMVDKVGQLMTTLAAQGSPAPAKRRGRKAA